MSEPDTKIRDLMEELAREARLAPGLERPTLRRRADAVHRPDRAHRQPGADAVHRPDRNRDPRALVRALWLARSVDLRHGRR